MAEKNIFLTEEQIQYIKENSNKKKGKWHSEPKKVLIVKKYLDSGFKKGKLTGLGEDGYPKEVKIVAMLAPNGEVLKNMTANQLFYLLQDRFSHIFSETDKRDGFLKAIMKDWYEDRISKNGLLSMNIF